MRFLVHRLCDFNLLTEAVLERGLNIGSRNKIITAELSQGPHISWTSGPGCSKLRTLLHFVKISNVNISNTPLFFC